jgi:hypothetical protein
MKLPCRLCKAQFGIDKVVVDPETGECLNGLSWRRITVIYTKHYTEWIVRNIIT